MVEHIVADKELEEVSFVLRFAQPKVSYIETKDDEEQNLPS